MLTFRRLSETCYHFARRRVMEIFVGPWHQRSIHDLVTEAYLNGIYDATKALDSRSRST